MSLETWFLGSKRPLLGTNQPLADAPIVARTTQTAKNQVSILATV
jgi:hypothetical protein